MDGLMEDAFYWWWEYGIQAAIVFAPLILLVVGVLFVWFIDTCEHRFMNWWRSR